MIQFANFPMIIKKGKRPRCISYQWYGLSNKSPSISVFFVLDPSSMDTGFLYQSRGRGSISIANWPSTTGLNIGLVLFHSLFKYLRPHPSYFHRNRLKTDEHALKLLKCYELDLLQCNSLRKVVFYTNGKTCARK